MSKERKSKGINLNIEVHRLLKLEALLQGKNMTELAEQMILDSISDEVKALVNSNSEIIETILNNNSKRNKKDENNLEEKSGSKDVVEEKKPNKNIQCYM